METPEAGNPAGSSVQQLGIIQILKTSDNSAFTSPGSTYLPAGGSVHSAGGTAEDSARGGVGMNSSHSRTKEEQRGGRVAEGEEHFFYDNPLGVFTAAASTSRSNNSSGGLPPKRSPQIMSSTILVNTLGGESGGGATASSMASSQTSDASFYQKRAPDDWTLTPLQGNVSTTSTLGLAGASAVSCGSAGGSSENSVPLGASATHYYNTSQQQAPCFILQQPSAGGSPAYLQSLREEDPLGGCPTGEVSVKKDRADGRNIQSSSSLNNSNSSQSSTAGYKPPIYPLHRNQVVVEARDLTTQGKAVASHFEESPDQPTSFQLFNAGVIPSQRQHQQPGGGSSTIPGVTLITRPGDSIASSNQCRSDTSAVPLN